MKIKRGISLLLAVALLSTMVMTVSADEITQTGTDTIQVSADMPVTTSTSESHSGEVKNDVLGIKVSWNVDTLTLHCEEDYALKWSPEDLKYIKDTEETNNVYAVTNSRINLCSVTNLSLYDVSVTPSFVANEALANTNIANYFYFTSSSLAKATVDDDTLEATGTAGETKTISCQIMGNITDAETVYNIIKENKLTSVGTVTLTVAKASS